MKNITQGWFVYFLLCKIFFASGQPDSTQKPSWAILPIAYFTPETSWVLGAGAVTNFKLGQFPSQTYESQISTGFAYTLFNQFLSFGSWRIFTEQNQSLWAGEAGWYDYVFFFFGTGNDVMESSKESFNARLPRLRLDYLRQLSPNLYLGLRYHFDNFAIKETAPGGLLETHDFIGKDGGRTSGFGPMLYFDSRDSQLYPLSGFYAESSLQYFGPGTGSMFTYWRWLVDIREIYELKENHQLLWNIYHERILGDAPFYLLPQLGGNRRMRGLFEGKYRDNQVTLVQGEYRWKFRQRWGLVAFGGIGNVYNQTRNLDFSNTRVAYGSGIRFQLSNRSKLNLRLDVAHAPGEGLLTYLTFGEAF